MNTFFSFKKIKNQKRRGFILGVCIVMMTVITLFTGLLILMIRVDQNENKLDEIFLEHENAPEIIARDFVLGRIDARAQEEISKDDLFPYNKTEETREGILDGYLLTFDYKNILPEGTPGALKIQEKGTEHNVLLLEVHIDDENNVIFWKKADT